MAAVGAVAGFLLLAGAFAEDGQTLWASASLLVSGTSFGLPWIMRIGLALALFACAVVPFPAAVVPTIAAALLATDGWIGHAAVAGSFGQGFQVVHVLAAAGWFGGLVGLHVELRRAEPVRVLWLLQRFTWIGLAFVLLVSGSGLANAYRLLAGILAAPSGTYIAWLAVKLAFVAVMLACAALNRFRFTPALKLGAKRLPPGLRPCVAVELAAGILALAAVSVLGTLSPG